MDAKELLEKYEQGQRNFRIENLSRLDMKGLELNGVDFRGADFNGADLSNVSLTDVNLQGADLSQAILTKAKLRSTNLTRAVLKGANLRGIDCKVEAQYGGGLNQSLRTIFRETDLSNADLSEAIFYFSDFSNANLNNANLNKAYFYHSYLINADIEKVNLSYAKLTNSNLTGASLVGSDLNKADLEVVKFQGKNLQEIRLRAVNLNKFNLVGLNISFADLSGANLENANLRKANLQGANLEKANLQGANLTAINLENANLKGADLSDAITYGWGVDGAEFASAIMPDGEIFRLELDRKVKPKELSLGRVELMTRKIIKTEKAPAPVGPYNQAIAASGQLLFVSGQIAIDPRSNTIVYTDDVAKQTEQVMANLKAVLAEAGASFEDVVKTTIFLKDMNDFATVNQVYSGYFDPENAPARACVEVSRLPKDVLVEIDCIAVV